MFLEDVRHIVEAFPPSDFDTGRFRSAIRMLEGTFIEIGEATPGLNNQQRVVVIRDPSVRDYLWGRLAEGDGEADALLRNAIYFEQCVILYEGHSRANSEKALSLTSALAHTQVRDVLDHEDVACRAVDLLMTPSPKGGRWVSEDSGYYHREPMSLERRISFLLDIFAEHQNNPRVTASANSALTITIEEWEAGRCSLSDALRLLVQAMKMVGFPPNNLIERAERALFKLTLDRLQQREGFEVLIGLTTLRPHLMSEPQRGLELWSSEFEGFLENERVWLLEEIDDPDLLEDEIRELGEIASALGVDITELEADAEDRRDVLLDSLDWEPDDYDFLRDSHSDPTDEQEVTEVDTLFYSLHSSN